jgi:hypothetical protein
MNLDLEILHKWTIEDGLCLNPRKTQAMIINCPTSVAADASAIYLAGQQISYTKSVKNLGLVLNNAFSSENQVNIICRRVYFALRRLWSTASYTPVRTRRTLTLQFFFVTMWSFPKLLRDFVINYKWHSILVLDMCSVFQDGIIFLIMLTLYLECRLVSFSVSEYAARLYNIISSGEPSYLHDSIQFDRSRRLGEIIIPRHNYTA